ncbi:MAG TPA: glycosyltransferase family 2 protein [Chitinophagaceae bacterium]
MVTDQLPKVSICIPAYNQTVYLNILLRSIASQTFTGYEIILSDDSSTEDVKNLVDTFSFGPKLKYYRNRPPLGSPSNWNAAIQKATGKYVKIMHHDDAFTHDTSLAEMVNCIESSNYDYVFSNTTIEIVTQPGQNRIHTIQKLNELIKKPYLLFFGNSIGSPSTLLHKREQFATLHYDPSFIWLVDIEYYTRLFAASSNGGLVTEPHILTHGSAEHQLTSKIVTDFDLQVKEQVLLYNNLAHKAPAIYRFFIQVCLVRLFFKAGTENKELTKAFAPVPSLVKTYFALVKYKPLYFAYHLFIRLADIIRKVLF